MARCKPKFARRSRVWSLALLAGFALVVLAGCDNSCILIVSNPGGSGGTIGVVAGNPPPTCPVPTLQGTVEVVAHATRLCDSCSPSNQVQGVLVSLRGIELHPKGTAGKESSEWRELFPALRAQPRQFDVMKAAPNGLGANLLWNRAIVPAGTYDLVRLRFASNPESPDDQLVTENACGKAGLHCVVMGDGRILPLVLQDNVLELRISAEGTARGLLISPGSQNRLLIELTPVWSAVALPPEGGQFLPVLTGSARKSSEN